MFWLASGIFIGSTIPFFGSSLEEMIDITRGAFSSEKMAMAKTERDKKGEESKGEESKGEESKGEDSRLDMSRLEMSKEEEEEQKKEWETKLRMLSRISAISRKIEREEEMERKREEMKRKTELMNWKRERESKRVAFMLRFLSSLVFGAGAIGGFIVVGQMLEDYGSCILLS
jgi:hypothetical protein